MCWLCLVWGVSSVTIRITGNQTVSEGANVTFNCFVDLPKHKLRSNWLLIFPDNRNMTNIRLQSGIYTPKTTNPSLFHVPKISFPGLQQEFTFVRISRLFDMVEVQCFNGDARNSSFIRVIRKIFWHIHTYTVYCILYTV